MSDMYRDYILKVESIYNKDYQTEQYYAIVLDKSNNVVSRSDVRCRDYDEAFNIAKKIVDEIYIKEKYGFDSKTKKVWVAKNKGNYLKILLYIILSIIVWLIFFVIFGEIMLLVLALLVIIGSPLILIFSQRKQIINFGSFVYDDGLYLVMFNNNRMVGANILSMIDFGGLGATYAIKGLKDNESYLNYVKEIKDITKLSLKPVIWKFKTIDSVTKLNGDNYRIVAEYIDLKKEKTKKITFTLKNRYDDFTSLVNEFNMMRNKQ